MKRFVIHSAGKCGSMSVFNTLKKAGYNVIHAHIVEGKRNPNDEYFVITPIRELISRNISAYFENCYKDGHVSASDFVIGLEGRHMRGATFFDERFKPYWDIDVYKQLFNTNIGWKIYKHDNVKALVIRLEDIDQWSNAFFSLTGDTAPKLKVFNKTRYAEYRRFLKQEIIPKDYKIKMWATKFYQHFYSDWLSDE